MVSEYGVGFFLHPGAPWEVDQEEIGKSRSLGEGGKVAQGGPIGAYLEVETLAESLGGSMEYMGRDVKAVEGPLFYIVYFPSVEDRWEFIRELRSMGLEPVHKLLWLSR